MQERLKPTTRQTSAIDSRSDQTDGKKIEKKIIIYCAQQPVGLEDV